MVIKRDLPVVELVRHSSVVDVISKKEVVNDKEEITHIIEVMRKFDVPLEIEKGAIIIETVKSSGSIVNVGSGPELPGNPYEGLIWIKT